MGFDYASTDARALEEYLALARHGWEMLPDDMREILGMAARNAFLAGRESLREEARREADKS